MGLKKMVFVIGLSALFYGFEHNVNAQTVGTNLQVQENDVSYMDGLLDHFDYQNLIAHCDEMLKHPISPIGENIVLAYRGYALFGESQIDDALTDLKKAENFFRNDAQSKWYGFVTIKLADCYAHVGLIGQSQRLVLDYLRFNRSGQPSRYIAEAYDHLGFVAERYSDIELNSLYLDSARFSRQHSKDIPVSSWIRYYLSRAANHSVFGKYEDALTYYDSSLQVVSDSNVHPLHRARVLMDKAALLRTMQLGNQSLDLLYEAEEIVHTYRPKGHFDVARIQHALGNALNKAGENEMAIRAFDRALEESKNQEGRHHILFRASILHDKALTLTDLNKDISAIRLLNEARELVEPYTAEWPQAKRTKVFAAQTLADYYLRNNEYHLAIKHYDELEAYILAEYGKRSDLLIQLYNNKSIALSRLGYSLESIELTTGLFPIFNYYPDSVEHDADWRYLEYLYQVVWNISDSYWVMYKKNKNPNHLKASLKYLAEDAKMSQKLIQGYRDIEARRAQVTADRIIYERILHFNALLQDTLGHCNHNEVFDAMENSRALELLLAINASNLNKSNVLPKETKTIIDSLKKQINYLDKMLIAHEKRPIKLRRTDDIARLKNKKAKLRSRYLNNEKKAESTYPLYKAMKYSKSDRTLQQFQHQLEPDQSVLYFFSGPTVIYAYLINKDTAILYGIGSTSTLSTSLLDIERHIHAQSNSAVSNIDGISDSSFIAEAKNLYDLIFRSNAAIFKKRIAIIPDGLLSNLPFDALISNDAKTFAEAQFLIHDHSVSYQYSLSLWDEMSMKDNKSKRGLAVFSPYFPPHITDSISLAALSSLKTDYENQFWELKYSDQEIRGIENNWPLDLIEGKDATVERFKQLSSNYRVLHLSTHGKADSRMGDFCYLAFSETSDSTSSKLYVRDLYDLDLEAEMVVLSACQSGIGEIQNGEGVLSLARAFTYAGAKSIVSTLWSVNEKSTSDIIGSFYAHLKTGMSKDEAIHQAKLDYLGLNQNVHPFYWAAFTAVGDMSPITSSNYSLKWWVLSAAIFFLVLWFAIKKSSMLPNS